MTTKNLVLNAIIDEIDFLVSELRDLDFSTEDILDGLAVYLDIAESLDDPDRIGDLY